MLLQLLIAYSICFGIQHKLPFLRGRSDFLDEMLTCTYCTGFHAGWMTWMFVQLRLPKTTHDGLAMLAFSLATAAFCYALDAGIQYLERGHQNG